MKTQKKNSYDEIRGMLNIIRRLESNKFKTINEQEEEKTDTDFIVINDVEVEIDTDKLSGFVLQEDEKNKISQIIDEFRDEVSELTDFSTLKFYENSAKLEGNISDLNINFILSAGDDDGLFLTNTSLMKINDETTLILEKLKKFTPKFISTMEEIILKIKTN